MSTRIVLSRRGVQLTLIHLEDEQKISLAMTKGQAYNKIVFEGEDIKSFVDSMNKILSAYLISKNK